MAISLRQKQLVQGSFAKVVPIADTAATIFYDKLFEFAPKVRSMFKSDLSEQKKKLMTALTVAVKGLDDIPKLVKILQNLAETHVQYGVKAEHFSPVGNALLFALKQGLGDEFDQELREAWIAVIHVVADTMKAHSFPE